MVVSNLFPPLVYERNEDLPDGVYVVVYELARLGDLIEHKPEQAWQLHPRRMRFLTSQPGSFSRRAVGRRRSAGRWPT